MIPLGLFLGQDGGVRRVFFEEQEEWIWSHWEVSTPDVGPHPSHCLQMTKGLEYHTANYPSPTYSWISFLFKKLRNAVMYWRDEEINMKEGKNSQEINVHYYGKEKLWLMWWLGIYLQKIKQRVSLLKVWWSQKQKHMVGSKTGEERKMVLVTFNCSVTYT